MVILWTLFEYMIFVVQKDGESDKKETEMPNSENQFIVKM